MGDGVDAIGVVGSDQEFAQIIRSARQAGFRGPIGSAAAVMDGDLLAQLGGTADPLLLTSPVRLPGVDQTAASKKFLASRSSYAPNAKISFTSVNAYIGVEYAADALRKATTLDSDGLIGALNQGEFNLGLVAPFSNRTASKASHAPRLFNPAAFYYESHGGKYQVATADPVDVTG
jgi:ABC-type branched-subunit amino acid transport system substrate-binding protein